MKKTLATRLDIFSGTQTLNMKEWINSKADALAEKCILKGFINVSPSESPQFYIQSNTSISTSHEALLNSEFSALSQPSSTNTRYPKDDIIGFQLILERDTHNLLFNPASNQYGSVRSLKELTIMWDTLTKHINFSGTSPSLFIKSKHIPETLQTELTTEIKLDPTSSLNKKLFPSIHLHEDGRIEFQLSTLTKSDSDSTMSLTTSESSGDFSVRSSFSSVMTTESLDIHDIPPEDVVHTPPLLQMMSTLTSIITPIVSDRHPFALGNSLSWPVELVGAKTNTPVGFIPFSGNSVNFSMTEHGPSFIPVSSKQIPTENETLYRAYLKEIGFSPRDIIEASPKKMLFEYTETGRGLYTFLTFMDKWAKETQVLPQMRANLDIIVFQGKVAPDQTPAEANIEFKKYPTTFINLEDKDTLKQLCDNDSLRLVPSHYVYKTQSRPTTNHTDPLVQLKKQALLNHL